MSCKVMKNLSYGAFSKFHTKKRSAFCKLTKFVYLGTSFYFKQKNFIESKICLSEFLNLIKS
jgi:hypothetical protein